MLIYGVALLATCLVIGMLVGQALGAALGIDANVGGVGIAMLLLVIASNSARFKDLSSGAAAQGKALRVAVEGGGCSGFQYEITLDEPRDDDLVLKGEGETVVVDTVSLPFLAGATIDFTDELIGARFAIDNPNATSSCGCGS